MQRVDMHQNSDCQLYVTQIASDGVYLQGGFGDAMKESSVVHQNCDVWWDLNHKLENAVKIVKQKLTWIDHFSKLSNKVYKATKTAKWTKRMEQHKIATKMDELNYLTPQKFHEVNCFLFLYFTSKNSN